jgi:hypothetical protein
VQNDEVKQAGSSKLRCESDNYKNWSDENGGDDDGGWLVATMKTTATLALVVITGANRTVREDDGNCERSRRPRVMTGSE